MACGMRKSAVSCEGLEESLRNQFAEITWVSAEIKGTRLTVRIKENEAMLSPVEPDRTPCDLAAEKDGVIERCVVRNGLLKVRAGDPVAAGDLLVAGTIQRPWSAPMRSGQTRRSMQGLYTRRKNSFRLLMR